MPAKRSPLGPNLLLQAARKRRGWSQTRLDSELRRVAKIEGHELPQRGSLISMISRWENTGRVPDVYYRYLLRQVYEASDADLGFPDTEYEFAIQPPAFSASKSIGDLTTGFDNADAIDVRLLDDLQTLKDVYRRMDRRLGAPLIVSDLTNHLQRITECGH